jgi:TPR repeat protein
MLNYKVQEIDDKFVLISYVSFKLSTSKKVSIKCLVEGKLNFNTDDPYYLAIIYELQEKYDAMIKECDKICDYYTIGNYYKYIKDYDNMINYYIKAIEKGCTLSMINLSCYYGKFGDILKMQEYAELAASLENFTGLFNLATMYKNIYDNVNAIKYYNICANHGNVDAMCCLAKLHKKNDKVRYWQLAADHGNVNAMYNLGRHFRHNGDKINMEKYLKMAIDLECSQSMYYYSKTEVNRKTSDKYLVMAGKLNNKKATRSIILRYKYVNPQKLLKILTELAKKDNIAAIKYLANYYFKKNERKNVEKYFKILIEKEDMEYIIKFGTYYENQNDIVNMIKYYELGVEKGNIIAVTLLMQHYEKAKNFSSVQKYAAMLTM